MKRFQWKRALSLFVVAAMALSCVPALAETSALEPALVTISSGEILGYNDNGVYAFKGVPYGTAARFEEATAPEAWDGAINCLTYGEVCPQDRTLASDYHTNDAEWITPAANDMCGSEASCLNLNVWTDSLNADAKKPVIVFMHGGGLSNGSSGELAVYEGTNFARNSNVVFVSVNMRLNYLGFLDVSAYGDETFKNSGNLGLTDMVLALKWVQSNIAAFGGDAENVTIYGQSGGGTKVTSLACLPAAEGLFNRVVNVNGSYTTIKQEDQQAETAKLVEYLGLSDSDDVIATLKDMSYEELFAACQQAGVSVGAEIDGDYYPTPWYDAETGKMNEYAAKRTYLISSTFSEFITSGQKFLLDERFHGPIDMNYYRPNMTEEWKSNLIAETFGDKADEILAKFAEAFPYHDPIDAVWYTNRNGRTMGQVEACLNNNIVFYNSLIAYDAPFMGGVTMWHSGDIGYWFNSLSRIAYQVKGDEETAQYVADSLSSALAAFAATGDPSTEQLKWDAYTAENPVTMVFDKQCYEKANLDTDLLPLMYGE
ncbi:MAG: carboxylesterase family protein [Eubacteriales bacterium]|nr:carboxylesterase family protein [Eubacteriales bacterium]